MKKLLAYIVLLAIFFSGLWKPLIEVITWLVTQNMKDNGLTISGEIFVKVATWLISFALVGAIFDAIGYHNSEKMSTAYFIISSIVSIALSYVVMILEKYFVWVLIGVSVLLIGFIALTIYLHKKYPDDIGD